MILRNMNVPANCVGCVRVGFLGLLVGFAAGGRAQEVALNRLPEAPGAMLQQAAARVFGTVVDSSGASIAGAKVTLVGLSVAGEQVVTTDAGGVFSFAKVSGGSYRITVTAAGFGTSVSDAMQVVGGEDREMPAMTLAVATANSEAQVTVSNEQMATEQVRAEEKQKVFGVFPNFYTTFLWQAAPLGTKQKFSLALRSVVDPVAFAGAAATAGIEQANDTFPGYGKDAPAFGERFGAAYADQVDARMIGSAILPALLHQDPRYFYKGTGSVGSRVRYAIKEAFFCRGDNGKQQVNVSYIGGVFLAAGLANVYRVDEDRSASLTIRNGFALVGGKAVSNVARELLFKRLTTHVPVYAQGQP